MVMVPKLTVVLVASALMSCVVVAPTLAQTGAGARCVAVKARNVQEAVMMEAASHRKGCWTRTAKGQLVFISSELPTKGYKAPSRPAPRARPRARR